MRDDIIQSNSIAPSVSNVGQFGEKNINVNNVSGAVVNIYCNNPQVEAENSTEKMMAIHRFSKEYYQLLVTCEDDVWKKNRVTISTSRALCQKTVPDEIFERCSSLSTSGIEELKTIPAIVCRENTGMGGVTDPNQMAAYAYIEEIKNVGKNIVVLFQPIAMIYQSILCDEINAIRFNLNMQCKMTDLNRSHWIVRKVNLFDAFRKTGITNMPEPIR